MARQVNQVLYQQWRQRIERQRVSGLSISGFCHREGITQASFYAWKRRFHEERSVGRRSSKVRTPRHFSRPNLSGSSRKAPERLPTRSAVSIPAADFVQLPLRGTRSSPWIELSLVDGTLIRIPQENLAALAALLRMLRDGEGLGHEARHA